MFIKITKSGPRRYAQLVEAFRDEAGAVRHRHVANLGRLDQADPKLERLIASLQPAALEKLKGLQRHHVKLGDTQMTGLTATNDDIKSILRQLELPLPTDAAVT
jgi:hypothetical protein